MRDAKDPCLRPGLPVTGRSLPFALLRAREKVMGPIRAMLSDSGITEQQWRILRVLDERGAMEPTKLAERASLLLPSQTRIVQTLVNKRFVTRTENTNDRRRQTVSITPRGRAVITSNIEQASIIAKRYETVLGKKQLQILLDLLKKLDQMEQD